MGGLCNLLGQGKFWRDVIGKDFIQDQVTDSAGKEGGEEWEGEEEGDGEKVYCLHMVYRTYVPKHRSKVWKESEDEWCRHSVK